MSADARPSLEDLCRLYVIQIAHGRIKVGVSVRSSTRLANHRAIAEAHGCTPGPEWVSPPGGGTPGNERSLIEFCTARAAGRYRSEYFAGVRFLAAVREAVRLCGDQESARILARTGASSALTALAESRKNPQESLSEVVAKQRSLHNRSPWDGRAGRCTEVEAAEWLGVPEDKISELVNAGAIRHIPARGPHRRLYLRTADVEQIAARLVKVED